MKVLIDIGHPAHAHFFRNPIRLLGEHGHEVVVTSRDKEMALDLLGSFGVRHIPLSKQSGRGVGALAEKLVVRETALWKVVRRQRPDVMAAIGGIFIAHVGRMTRTPSLVFYDTENATLQNALTYPFATRVIVPRCYQAWLPRRSLRYDGYHELSYLHPDWFEPDREAALAAGLAEQGDTFLLRLVSWQASHDLGEKGWAPGLLERLLDRLEREGRVWISSEGPLPDFAASRRYAGDPAAIHQLMAHCRAFVGESATMASECAVLGVPALYVAETGRGYTDEQEARYGLVRNVAHLDWEHVGPVLEAVLAEPREHWQAARKALLADTLDVARFATALIESQVDPTRPPPRAQVG